MPDGRIVNVTHALWANSALSAVARGPEVLKLWRQHNGDPNKVYGTRMKTKSRP
jgi:hypothetical protein